MERWFDSSKSEEVRDALNNYKKVEACSTCKGSRLRPHALGVFIENLNIFKICNLSVDKCLNFIKRIKFKNSQEIIWTKIKGEIIDDTKKCTSCMG